MKRFFLYRLYIHSRFAFIILILFIIYYGGLFYKKMDTVFTPYNSMFSVDFSGSATASCYAVKTDGQLVHITRQPYWKKDFLEASLISYSNYFKQGYRLFMDEYLDSRISNKKMKIFLSERLLPGITKDDSWLRWYATFAGYDVHAGKTIELMRYDFIYRHDKVELKDSVCLLKNKCL